MTKPGNFHYNQGRHGRDLGIILLQ